MNYYIIIKEYEIITTKKCAILEIKFIVFKNILVNKFCSKGTIFNENLNHLSNYE